MPYLLLVIGLVIGFYALYRFFLNANILQIKAFIAAALSFVFGVALLYLALTGKLIAALVGLVGAAPVLVGWFRSAKSKADPIGTPQDRTIKDVEGIEIVDEEENEERADGKDDKSDKNT